MKNDVLTYFRSFPHEMDGDVMLYTHLGSGLAAKSRCPEVSSRNRCPYCGSDQPRREICVEGPGTWVYRKYGCGVMMATVYYGVDVVLGVSIPTDECAVRGFLSRHMEEDIL